MVPPTSYRLSTSAPYRSSPFRRELPLRYAFGYPEICRCFFHFAYFLIEGRALPIGQSIILIKQNRLIVVRQSSMPVTFCSICISTVHMSERIRRVKLNRDGMVRDSCIVSTEREIAVPAAIISSRTIRL